MKIEVWYDFNQSFYKQILEIDKFIKDLDIENLDLLYRSYPLSYAENILAHQVSHLAKKYFCQHEFILNLLGKLEKNELTKALIKEAALEEYLDEEQVDEVLNSDQYKEQVLTNKENAIYKDIFDIPHIRFEGKIKLNGFQDIKTLIKTLEKLKIDYKINEHCVGEHCGRKKTK